MIMEQKQIENMSWYVLRVMGGKEKKIVAAIEKEVDRLKKCVILYPRF